MHVYVLYIDMYLFVLYIYVHGQPLTIYLYEGCIYPPPHIVSTLFSGGMHISPHPHTTHMCTLLTPHHSLCQGMHKYLYSPPCIFSRIVGQCIYGKCTVRKSSLATHKCTSSPPHHPPILSMDALSRGGGVHFIKLHTCTHPHPNTSLLGRCTNAHLKCSTTILLGCIHTCTLLPPSQGMHTSTPSN